MRDADFARQLQELERYKRNGDWDAYLALAGSPGFLASHAAWTARKGQADATGPLGVLEFALDKAVQLQRVSTAAALTLATARWARRLAARTALAAAGSGGGASGTGSPGGARTGQPGEPGHRAGEADVRTGLDVLRALLRAWELSDDGNPGAARSLLAAVVRGRPALIRTSDGARWAVPLLRQALIIAPDATRLLGLVDDNVLGDLARHLTSAGEYDRARTAGSAMRLFHETKADILADLALAEAEAALKPQAASGSRTAGAASPGQLAGLRAAAETANLAADAALQAQQEGTGVAAKLAKAAAALTLAGDNVQAARLWAEAMAAAEREPEPDEVLAGFAKAQVRAGLLDDAAQVVGVLLGQAQPNLIDWQLNAVLDPAWQAASALVAAFAERGDTARATAVLRMIPDFAHSYPGVVRALARAIAAADVTEAERLAGRVRDPDGRGYALAAVAAAALSAGHQREAVRVAAGIEHPRWRARALVDIAGAAGQSADIPFDEVHGAITAVTDAEDRAVLLAEYAVTRDPVERRRLLAEATRLAGEAPADARWRALANVGATVAEAGRPADAREAFTAAQRLLATKPREWDFELYQLCLARLNAGDTVGARETVAVALGSLPGRKTAGLRSAVAALGSRRPSRPRSAVPDSALDQMIAAAEAVADGPVAVAALAAIACAMGEAAGLTPPGSALAMPSEAAGQIEPVLAEAERLAAGLHGAGTLVAAESLAHAYTALGDFAAAERRILNLLPPPDPSDGEDDEDEDEDEDTADAGLVAVARARATALADALTAVGQSEQAATFMREVAGRLAPCSWGLGPAARDLLAELAATQVRTGDIAGARATAAFASTVAQGMTGAFRLPAPFGSPVDDWADIVGAVVDTMTALMREAEIGPADFADAGQRAIDYAYRPWQARAHTLAARAQRRDDPADRARLAELLASEADQAWRLATVTPVRGATLDLDDAAQALAVLAAAQAAIGDLSGARGTLAHARELAADIEDLEERARSDAEVAKSLSGIGDHLAAVSVARGIGHPVFQGPAIASAIAAAARAGDDSADGLDLLGEARAIEDSGWRAVALAAVALASPGPLNLDEINDLISEIAHGAPRTRAWREVIGLCLAAGQYDLAVSLANEITDDAGPYLAMIAAGLGTRAAGKSGDAAAAAAADREAARAALLRLLSRCARYPEAAYGACTALALAFPAEAARVASAVAQHVAPVMAATAGRSRG